MADDRMEETRRGSPKAFQFILDITSGEHKRHKLLNLCRIVAIGVACGLCLSGCFAAVAPIIAADVGAVGFSGYKLVQLGSGSKLAISFPGANGKESPIVPLPPARRVAVWPGDTGDVRLASALSDRNIFTVVTPEQVKRILKAADISSNLEYLTKREQDHAFKTICKIGRVDLIFADLSLGHTSKVNSFSFKRPSVTFLYRLITFSCAEGSIAWDDRIAITIYPGEGSPLPTDLEVMRAANDAWIQRIVAAEKAGSQSA